jgi:hypothetical protein
LAFEGGILLSSFSWITLLSGCVSKVLLGMYVLLSFGVGGNLCLVLGKMVEMREFASITGHEMDRCGS